MATELARRLPGIRVDVAPPPAAEALPRMDVAVFVGFASTGPLHLPVAVEGVAQYAAVFGADAPLAWDERRGERVQAHLGPAVRAFFANGGRRCWVIRVARTVPVERRRGGLPDLSSVAVSNRFALPGLLALPAGGALESAVCATRCEGSWSDRLRVGSALASRGLSIADWAPSLLPGPNRHAFQTRFALRPGDLLQLGSTDVVCAYAVVDAVAVVPDAAGPYHVEVRTLAAFARIHGTASPGTVAGTASVSGFSAATAASWLGDDPSAPAAAQAAPQRLRFDDPVPAVLETGHWARFEDAAGASWLRIDRLERTPAFAGSPPATSTSLVHAAASGPAWRELGAALPPELAAVTQARVLDVELRVAEGGAQAFRLTGVGLTPTHRTSFWALQTDAEFYRERDDRPPAPPAELPRFPLAPENGPAPLAWLPLAVDAVFGASLAPLPPSASALERDGLAHFDETLFLDPELADDNAATLIAHADDIRLIRDNPRALLGLHAVLGIGAGGLFNEASLLAIPDAVHLGWHLRVDPPPAPSEPLPGDPPDHWGTHRGPCASQTPAPADGPDFGSFIDCATRTIAAPLLSGPMQPVPPGPFRLSWTDSEPGAVYGLVEAHAADFSDAREIYRGTSTEYTVYADREGVYRYQVFAWRGDDRSAGSNALTVQVRLDEWVQDDEATAALEREVAWLAVQRAALRLAFACGDLFVALAMPRHFRTPEALRYTARLRAVRQPPGIGDVGAFGFDEARALSHGALYFPWAQSDLHDAASIVDPAQRLPRLVPPDGMALGMLASRASLRGAWIAPANQPMKDVVALVPPVRAADRQALQDAQVNLLRADPRGFFTLSADTLSQDADLRPINVRRLLILLRRLALRRGMAYAFEPNGAELRRAVQRSFNTLMTDLFRRGAFAGATPSQSFRVITDDTVNTPEDRDAGRFIVELHVAPALPMRFIAVRLAQIGERLSVVEEL